MAHTRSGGVSLAVSVAWIAALLMIQCDAVHLRNQDLDQDRDLSVVYLKSPLLAKHVGVLGTTSLGSGCEQCDRMFSLLKFVVPHGFPLADTGNAALAEAKRKADAHLCNFLPQDLAPTCATMVQRSPDSSPGIEHVFKELRDQPMKACLQLTTCVPGITAALAQQERIKKAKIAEARRKLAAMRKQKKALRARNGDLASQQVAIQIAAENRATTQALARLQTMERTLTNTMNAAQEELKQVQEMAKSANDAANTAALVAAKVPQMMTKRDLSRPGRNMFWVKQMMQPFACSDPDDIACETANLNLNNLVKATRPERNTIKEFQYDVDSVQLKQNDASSDNNSNSNAAAAPAAPAPAAATTTTTTATATAAKP